MAKKCYHLLNKGCNGGDYEFFVCADTLTTAPGGDCGGVVFTVDGQVTGSARSTQIEVVDCAQCAGCNCVDPVGPNQKCDCVNGGCVPKTTYNTPGKYANLAACQSNCGKDSQCEGECVPSAEIAALKQAADKAQANCCK
jgi:hypothetical protein